MENDIKCDIISLSFRGCNLIMVNEKWALLDEYIKKNFRPRIRKSPNDLAVPKGGKLFTRRQTAPIEMEPILRPQRKELEKEKLKDFSLDELLKDREITFQEKLFELIDDKNLKDSDVYQKANIDKRLFSKIRSDKDYHPSKETAILLALSLELEIDTALDFISRAGYSLSFSSKSDIIVRYFIENKNYDIYEVNQALFDYDQKLLFK